MPRQFKVKADKQFQSEMQMMLAKLDVAKHTTKHSTIYGENNELRPTDNQ